MKLVKHNRLTVYFCHSATLYLSALLILRTCGYSTWIHSGSSRGGMAASSFTVGRCNLPRYSVGQDNDCFGACLDGRQFSAICLAGNAKFLRDMRTGLIHVTEVGAWTKWWGHWGGRSATDSLYPQGDIDCPFSGCITDLWYERRIADILGHLQVTPFPK